MSKAAARREVPALRTITLTACVPDMRERKADYLDQEKAAAELGITTRTLRDWVTRGLPEHQDARGRPRYSTQEIFIWSQAYHRLTKEAELRQGRRQSAGQGWSPRHLTMQDAVDCNLYRQFHEWPDLFVVVPLGHDHPSRARQLERAAAGEPPDDADD